MQEQGCAREIAAFMDARQIAYLKKEHRSVEVEGTERQSKKGKELRSSGAFLLNFAQKKLS